jgi:hypothetical protein
MNVDIERALTELAARVDVGREPDLSSAVRARLQQLPAPSARRGWTWRPVVWTRRSIALAVGIVLVASSIAVASYFGVRGIVVHVGPTPTASAPQGAGTFMGLGARVGLDAARAGVRFPVRIPAGLGDPDEIYLDRALTGGMVTLLYHPRAGLPEASSTGTGVLLIEFEGSFSRATMQKFAEPGQVHETTVGGAHAIWLQGVHQVGFLDANGEQRIDGLRLSDSVLLWQIGSVTMRLESALSMEQATRLAETVH